MSLSMSGFYTKTYSQSNTNSYSTRDNSETHNSEMEYRDWLLDKLMSVGANPTDLADVSDGKLNQPTIQRILKGTTPNPRIRTVKEIEVALKNLGVADTNFYAIGNVIDSTSRRIDEKSTAVLPLTAEIKPKSARERRIDEINALLMQTDMEGLAVILDRAKDAARDYPLAKQTLESSG